MAGNDQIEADGVVSDVLSNGKFRVKLENGHEVLAHLAGKMKKNNIRVVLGDNVRVAMSPYDLSRGRIIFRIK